ncbi:DUF6146 family protein [Bizionia sp. KMM 8389]
MKNYIYFISVLYLMASCKSNKSTIYNSEVSQSEQDTIRIENEALEYEIIIIENGFDTWLNSRARPRDFYTQSFLEARNIVYVTEWNNRVISSRYDPTLYELSIDYQPTVDYGFEVNYLLYYYFVFFEEKYNQKLSVHNPQF